jgi:outer membrane receptor protein involved in Fe transport
VQGASSSFRASIPNIPAFTWRIAPAIKIGNWALVPALTLKSSYKVLTPTLGTPNSGAIVDLSAKVSYALSHRFNLNLDLYNLANNKAYMYFGYRQRGAMAVFGLTFKF